MCSGLSYPRGGLELERQAPSVMLADMKLLEQGVGELGKGFSCKADDAREPIDTWSA